MPSKSAAQHRLMEAAAHGWKKPGGGGPSAKVGKDFVKADKHGGKFGRNVVREFKRQRTAGGNGRGC
jgi:hypothetical protein